MKPNLKGNTEENTNVCIDFINEINSYIILKTNFYKHKVSFCYNPKKKYNSFCKVVALFGNMWDARSSQCMLISDPFISFRWYCVFCGLCSCLCYYFHCLFVSSSDLVAVADL